MSQSDQNHIEPPGTEAETTPQADHSETSYKGCDKLVSRVALIMEATAASGERWRLPMPVRAPTS